jgi:hypothetical protein
LAAATDLEEPIMQPPHTNWASEGTVGRWRYRYDLRYGLVGLVLGLAIIVLAIRGHWADLGWPLGTVVAGSSGFVWSRATPTGTRGDRDRRHTR